MPKELINARVFVERMAASFPEIREEILDEDFEGILVLQIGVFKKFTQSMIDLGDIRQVRRCFEFITSMLGVVEHEVENSIYISYLKKLKLDNPAIKKLIPTYVLQNLNVFHQHDHNSENNKKLNDFLKGLTDLPS